MPLQAEGFPRPIAKFVDIGIGEVFVLHSQEGAILGLRVGDPVRSEEFILLASNIGRLAGEEGRVQQRQLNPGLLAIVDEPVTIRPHKDERWVLAQAIDPKDAAEGDLVVDGGGGLHFVQGQANRRNYVVTASTGESVDLPALGRAYPLWEVVVTKDGRPYWLGSAGEP